MPKKILAVDDDPAFLEFLREALVDAGHQFLSARDGKEGVRLASAQRPDIVLLDIMMPQMHGYEACQKMREDSALAATKIIILSAKDYKVDLTSAKSAGADHYLVKPFRLAELLDVIGGMKS